MFKGFLPWQPVLLLVLFSLFFFGGPDYYSSRSFKAFWDLGHILFFFVLCRYLLVRWLWLVRQSISLQCVACILVALVAGGLIEAGQSVLDGRDASLADMARDVLGASCALVFFSPLQWPTTIKRLVQPVALMLFGLSLYPFIVVTVDEYAARKAFPLLADFETATEMSRWSGGKRSDQLSSSGRFALRVELSTAAYSGVELKYLPHNWSGYNQLLIDVFNPDTDSLLLTCRIHDKLHQQGSQAYDDRFNRRFRIVSGWNSLHIPVQAIIDAPQGRQMDIQNIRGLGCFAKDLDSERVIYLDNIRLID